MQYKEETFSARMSIHSQNTADFTHGGLAKYSFLSDPAGNAFQISFNAETVLPRDRCSTTSCDGPRKTSVQQYTRLQPNPDFSSETVLNHATKESRALSKLCSLDTRQDGIIRLTRNMNLALLQRFLVFVAKLVWQTVLDFPLSPTIRSLSPLTGVCKK